MGYADSNELVLSTSTWQPPEMRCEKCRHYCFFDSGYGQCRRYPPREEITGHWFWKKSEMMYPLVAWTQNACGEFKSGGIT